MNNKSILAGILLSAFAVGILTSAGWAKEEIHGKYSDTQGDMNRDGCQTFKKADLEMNKIYQQIISKYRNDRTFIDKFRKAQRAWVFYRDAQIQSIFPNQENPQSQYGSAYPMCYCGVEADLTENRIKALKEWTVGIEEGDVCTGSREIKH